MGGARAPAQFHITGSFAFNPLRIHSLDDPKLLGVFANSISSYKVHMRRRRRATWYCCNFYTKLKRPPANQMNGLRMYSFTFATFTTNAQQQADMDHATSSEHVYFGSLQTLAPNFYGPVFAVGYAISFATNSFVFDSIR